MLLEEHNNNYLKRITGMKEKVNEVKKKLY